MASRIYMYRSVGNTESQAEQVVTKFKLCKNKLLHYNCIPFGMFSL